MLQAVPLVLLLWERGGELLMVVLAVAKTPWSVVHITQLHL